MKHKLLLRNIGLLLLLMTCLLNYSFWPYATLPENAKNQIRNAVFVTSYFEDKTHFFYANDRQGGKKGAVEFEWDVTSQEQPSRKDNIENTNTNIRDIADKADSTPEIGVIELRNYVLKHGLRDSFIHYFEENFIQPQEALKGQVLGQYRVKGFEDNFCWIRGFKNMQERSLFLPTFYYGPVWKQHKKIANAMLANNDNVYLLKPLLLKNDSLEPAKLINRTLLIPTKGIAVVEFYTANTKLDQLLKLFAREYLPLLQKCGINDYTLWTSVLEENDFPALPVFQDKNLLVTISFYDNELLYRQTLKKIDTKMTDDIKALLRDVITIKNTMILYPTQKTTHKKSLL